MELEELQPGADSLILSISVQDDNVETKGRGFHDMINTHTLPCKASYLTMFSARGAYIPNSNVFLTSLGLSKSQAGLITGVRTMADMLGNPVWGGLADRTQKHKYIMVMLVILSTCFLVPQPWVAKYLSSSEHIDSCRFQNTSSANVSFNDNITRSFVTPKKFMNPICNPEKSGSAINNTNIPTASSKLFAVMLSMTGISYFIAGSIPNFIDTRVIRLVESSSTPATYGHQRVFGSIAFGSSAAISGFLADKFQFKNMSSYTAIFYVYLFYISIFLVIVLLVLFKKKIRSKESEKEKKPRVLKLALKTLLQPIVTFFFCSALVTGISAGTLYGFLYVYLEELHASKFLMGLNILMSCVVELVIFPFSSKIIRFLGGNERAMAIGLFTYFPRYMIMAFAKNGWVVLGTQVFHAPSFALFWAAAVQYTYQVSPKEIPTTLLGVFYAVYFGLGQLMANVFGGIVYDIYGGRVLFRSISLLSLFWSLIIFAVICKSVRVKRCTKEELENGNMLK